MEGDNRYLSSDLMSLFTFLASDSKKVCDIINEELTDNFVYVPGNSHSTNYKYSLLRNPHISKNESVQVRPLKEVGYYRNKYFSHLTDVIMVPDNSDIPMRLGGADFDGDMVKIIANRIIISYLYTKETEPEYYGKSDNPLPLLFIPTEEPIISDAKDWKARFETVKNTFSSRVGQISNAALNRSVLAYDENAKGKKAQYKKETETLAILTGLEIDSAKSSVKPDLSEYLVTNKTAKSLFLKYKSLIEKQNERRAWYEKTYKEIGDKMGFSKKQIQKFFERYRINQRKINAGQAIHKKGRPCKNTDNGIPPSIQKLDKLAQMRYVMASKDRYIKRLEMENELMRDFLSLTERK